MLRRGDKLNKTAELCTAARTGQLETLQRASKSALNRCTDDNDNDDVMMTPAMCAATHGQLAALRVIVERGADADRVDQRGNTTLHHAVLNNQRLCAMFLVHFGVNVWTLNDELMSAYDVAAASYRVNLARFLEAAAAQAFVDDWHRAMKMCRRAADNARRRLRSAGRHEINHAHSTSTQAPNGWLSHTALPDESSATFTPAASGSSMFIQSPRQANGRLFPPTAAATDTHSGGHGKQRRSVEHQQPLRAASAARYLLLVSLAGADDESLKREVQSRVVREQLRLAALANSRATNNNHHRLTPSSHIDRCQFYNRLTPSKGTDSRFYNGLYLFSHIDAQNFYCRPRVSDGGSGSAAGGRSSSEVASSSTAATSTAAAATTTPRMWPSTAATLSEHEHARRHRLHRQAGADVTSQSTTTGTAEDTCSDVYCDPADCIKRHHRPTATHRNHNSTASSLRSTTSTSGLGPPHTSTVTDGRIRVGLPHTPAVDTDDALRRWLTHNGLTEYWSALATEKVDLETITLLEDEDLRQLGVPLGPRRRLQRAASQLQSPPATALTTSPSDNCFVDNDTYL